MPFLLFACTADLKVGDTGASGADDTGAADTAHTTDPEDTDDTPPAVSAWAGTWTGAITLSADTPEGDDRVVCEGEGEIVVADDGTFVGAGACSNPEAPGELQLDVEGAVGDDGAVTGTVTHTVPDRDPMSYDLQGVTPEDALGFGWEGLLATPHGDEVAFAGQFTAE